MKERLLRGDECQRLQQAAFDPIATGLRYGLHPELSATIWEHVRREATDPSGKCDEHLARERFVRLAKRIAGVDGQPAVAPVPLDIDPPRATRGTS